MPEEGLERLEDLENSSDFVSSLVASIRANMKHDYFQEIFSLPLQIIAISICTANMLILVIKHDPNQSNSIKTFDVMNADEASKVADVYLLRDRYWVEKEINLELAYTLARNLSHIAVNTKLPLTMEFYKLGSGIGRNMTNDTLIRCLVNVYENKPEALLSSVESAKVSSSYICQNKDCQTISYPLGIEQTDESQSQNQNLYGAIWYPLFVFDDEPIRLKPVLSITANYKGFTIFLNNNCFIFVAEPTLISEKEKFTQKKAIGIFNEIIGTAQLFGVDGCSIGPNEYLILEVNHKLEPVCYFESKKPGLRSLLTQSYLSSPGLIYEFDCRSKFKRYTKALILEIIEKASKITENKTAKDFILSLLEAKTHLVLDEFKTSFILSWVVIEKYVEELWLNILVDEKIKGNRFEKLAKSVSWTVDDKLETLNLMHRLPDSRYSEIMALKSIRNKVIHDQRIVTQVEAEEAVKLTTELVKEIVRFRCYIDIG